MPAILQPAAQRISADVAGFTHTGTEPPPGQPVAATPAEILREALPSEHGGLSHIFSDSLVEIPVTPLHRVETAVSQPTSSIVGRLGGLIPQSTTPQSPGPRTAPGGVQQPMPNPIPSTLEQWSPGVIWPRLRTWLGL